MKKTIVLIMLALFSVPLFAAGNAATGTNKVYIEQLGSTNTITIEQVGGTNNVGGNTGTVSVSNTDHVTTMTPDAPSSSNYALINGSTNVLTLTQHGDNNWAQYNIKGSNNTYTSTITGSNNKTKLTLGDTNTNNLRNTILQAITGDTNYMIQSLLGNDIYTSTTIGGNSNQVTQTLNSTNGHVETTITGDSNLIINEQIDAAGATGHYLKQAFVGDYNSVTTQQQGSNDTSVDIATTGSHNTITVRTSSSSISNSQTAIAR